MGVLDWFPLRNRRLGRTGSQQVQQFCKSLQGVSRRYLLYRKKPAKNVKKARVSGGLGRRRARHKRQSQPLLILIFPLFVPITDPADLLCPKEEDLGNSFTGVNFCRERSSI